MSGEPRAGVLVHPQGGATREYLGWGIIAIAYAIAFAQRVSPQTVNLHLIVDLSTDAAGVALLASGYFWGYAVMQLPAGLLVDRYGVRRIVLCSMLASVSGSAAFALSETVASAFVARLMLAIGDALVFTCLLKLVAQRFPDARFGLISGLSQVSGYVGGALATVPLATAINGIGWRACFLTIALIGAVNAMGALAILPTASAHQVRMTFRDMWRVVGRALSQAPNWGCALTFASHYVVVVTLSGVWGLPLVAHTLNLDPAQASAPLLAFMVGQAVGSIVLGHAADRVASIGQALMLICLGRMFLIALLVPPVLRELGLVYAAANFAILGLITAGTIPLVLKCTKKLYTTELIGTGASVNTTTANLLAAVAQPVIGVAMLAAGAAWGGTGDANVALSEPGYVAMIFMLLALSTLGFVGPLLMRKAAL